jgi:hypothetical protein
MGCDIAPGGNAVSNNKKRLEDRLVPLGLCVGIFSVLGLFLCRVLAEIPWIAWLLGLNQDLPWIIRILIGLVVVGCVMEFGAIAISAARSALD